MTSLYLTTSFKAGLALIAGFMVGCMTIPDDNPNHRKSVEDMMQAQTANPDAGRSIQTMQPVDGAQAAGVIADYRRPAGEGKQIKNEIHVNVGN